MGEACPFEGARWPVEISSCGYKYVYMLMYIKAKGIFVFVKTLCSSLIKLSLKVWSPINAVLICHLYQSPCFKQPLWSGFG